MQPVAPSSAYAAVIELASAALEEPFERTPTLVAARIALQMLLDRCTALQRDLAATLGASPALLADDASPERS